MTQEAFKLDNQLCFRLYTASRLLTQAYHPLLSEHGLTYPQYLVLLVLWEKDAQPVNYIAKRLLLETNTVTPLLQRMEKEGILVRKKGEKDAQPVNDIAKRLYLETNTVTPLLQRMEKEGIIIRNKGEKDARQMIVSLTGKGKKLQKELADVPFTVGQSVICDSVTAETTPELFRMLDDIILKLSSSKA